MKRTLWFSIFLLAACGGASKSKDLNARIALLEARVKALSENDENSSDRLDEQEERLEAVEKRGRPERPVAPRRPDPSQVYGVDVTGSPYEGPKDAWVTIVKAYEYACPFCERARGTMEQIRAKYGKNVRIVYKHFIVHPDAATIPALTACAAHLQGKFKAVDRLIWEKGYKNNRRLDRDHMVRLAKQAGVNVKRLKADMDGPCRKRVAADQAGLAAVGVVGTPAFFVNGRHISGARPLSHFTPVIDEELRKAKASGVPADKYYDTVRKKGLVAQ